MLKHIKPRDLIEFFLFGLAFLALVVVAGYLESTPVGTAIWVAVVLAIVLWITWFLLVARDRNRDAARPKLKMMRNGEWVDVDTLVDPANLQPAQFFDQDNVAPITSSINEVSSRYIDINKEQV